MNKRIIEFACKANDEASNGGKVYIEGYANKAVMDRIGDVIPSKEWNVDSFKRNPIIFFNHDRDWAIGQADKIEVKDDGLYIGATISNSDTEKVKYVRDLIKDGILKTFSVGFVNSNQERSEKGENVLKGVELLEVSVVTIPMNVDSEFSSSLKTVSDYMKFKQLVVDHQKGAMVAEALRQSLSSAMEQNSTDAETILNDVMALATDATLDQLTSILNGQSEPSDDILNAFSQVLGNDLDELRKLVQSDNEQQPSENQADGTKPDTSKPSEDEAGANEPTEPPEDKKPEKEASPEEGSPMAKVPKPEDDEDNEPEAEPEADPEAQKACATDDEKKPDDKPENEKQATQDGVDQPTVPVDTRPDDMNPSNPMIAAMNQTNVLLGSLINKFDQLSQTMVQLTSTLTDQMTELAKRTNSSDTVSVPPAVDAAVDAGKNMEDYATKALKSIETILDSLK